MNLTAFQKSREMLLATITKGLLQDERVVAAWLLGSDARGESDAVSDIDLSVAIVDAHSQTLCRREEMVTARPADERLALFSQFGEPVNVHENNHNAPPGGTFTSILYRSAHIVDWILVPSSQVQRPDTSLLLFERVPIARRQPPTPPEPGHFAVQVAEQVAFFWMMSAVVAKYLVRGELGFARCRLDELWPLVRYVECSLNGREYVYHRGLNLSWSVCPSLEEVRDVLVSLGDKMEAQMAIAGTLGIALQPAPREALGALLELVKGEDEVTKAEYKLEELLAGITPENLHAEFDWGEGDGQS